MTLAFTLFMLKMNWTFLITCILLNLTHSEIKTLKNLFLPFIASNGQWSRATVCKSHASGKKQKDNLSSTFQRECII